MANGCKQHMISPRISRRRFLKAAGAFGTGLFGLSSYSLVIEPKWRLDVTRYTLSPPLWPRGL